MNKSRGTIVVRLSFNAHEFQLKSIYDKLVTAQTEPERRHILKMLLAGSVAPPSIGSNLGSSANPIAAAATSPVVSLRPNSAQATTAIESDREPIIPTLEPRKGFVYTGSNMYSKDQLY
jgi:hypothetical protein